MTEGEAFKRLDQIYRMLPNIECKRKCRESCGIIAMSPLEFHRMQKARPFEQKVLSAADQFVCPQLNIMGDCNVHPVRPIVCRLFGLVEKMRCPHGCVPDRWVPDYDAGKIMKEIRNLSMQVTGKDGVALTHIVK